MKALGLCTVIGLLAGILLSVVHVQEEPFTPVIITKQPLPRGTVLLPELLYGDNAVVEVQHWTAELAPQTAFGRLEDLEGLVVRLDLPTRSPLLAGNLVSDATLASAVGSDTGLLIPEGTLGVPLRVDNLAGAPFDLGELDCVRVQGVFDFGRTVGETPLLLAAWGVVVENVAGSEVVTIALPSESALALVWAQDNAISLLLEYGQDCPSAG